MLFKRYSKYSITIFLCLFSASVYLWFLNIEYEKRIELLYAIGVYDSLNFKIFLATFTHTKLTHLFFNMVGISILGGWLENCLDKLQYFITIVVSIFFSWLYYILRVPIKPAVGASGLVFGFLGVFIGLQNRTIRRITLILAIALIIITLPNLPPDATDIHLAGFLIGVLLSIIFSYANEQPNPALS